MFQIKARVDYGLMIMLQLAREPKHILSLSGLAKRLGISSIYLIQISQSLTKAGLIKSKEGSRGGYILARAASQISLLAIIEALEGDIEARCLSGGKQCACLSSCQIRDVWSFILGDIRSTLKKRTLASLLKKSL
jgi:Rrf2 family iron-sulfur cluster assembly transcriptional regulator